jgi:tight adherence protein B
MSALLALVAGAAVGVGLLLVAFGLAGRGVLPDGERARVRRRSGTADRLLLLRAVAAFVAGTGMLFVTGWAAGALLAAGACWAAPAALGGRRRHQAEIARVEAIASWTEMLRDTLAGANGLEQAVVATAAVAPEPIAPAVGRLAARLDHGRVADSLRRFAAEVDHPTCDFVVAALLTAVKGQARELGPLLTQLAECARDEAQLRARVWAGRARTRTSVRVIASCVALFALGLLLFDRSYLEPYDSVGGQAALLAIGGIFVGSILAMERMGRIELPERFLGRREEPA